MLELAEINGIILDGNIAIKKTVFYKALNLSIESLTTNQFCEFERLRKLVYIAIRNNTIKFKSSKLAREILLAITEINTKDKSKPLHIKRLISNRMTIESEKLIDLVGFSQKQKRRANKKSFNLLEKEIKQAHKQRVINTRNDHLTIKVMLLIHETPTTNKVKL